MLSGFVATNQGLIAGLEAAISLASYGVPVAGAFEDAGQGRATIIVTRSGIPPEKSDTEKFCLLVDAVVSVVRNEFCDDDESFVLEVENISDGVLSIAFDRIQENRSPQKMTVIIIDKSLLN